MKKNERLIKSGFPVGQFSRIWGRIDQTAKTISIGDFVTLGINAFVASHCPVKGIYPETLRTTIENDVWIGYGAYIAPGTHIHKRTIIGMGSVVSGNIESDSVYVGNPARRIKLRNPIEVVRTRLYMVQGLGPNDNPKWNVKIGFLKNIFPEIKIDISFLCSFDFCKKYITKEMPNNIEDAFEFLNRRYNG